MRDILFDLKKSKKSGSDDIPAEFWQLCIESDLLFQRLLQFCSQIWVDEYIPDKWHHARVACLFKKGDPAMPENYRPISRLQISYEIFAGMILRRFKIGGIEDQL